MINTDLQALLEVQDADEQIRALDAKRDALTPGLAALDAAKRRTLDEATRAETALTRELDRLHALERRITEHRERHEKNLAILNQAHKLKEATAAMSQVETARRVLADDESEALALTRRVAELRATANGARAAADAIDDEQRDARARIDESRGTIEVELREARAERAGKASQVGAPLLSRYDRVSRNRGTPVLFAMGAGYACGHCDTAIPMQRRPAMTAGGSIETCEGCGMLLYLAPQPAVAAAVAK